MEPTLDDMIQTAANTIAGSHFAPKSSGATPFDWNALINQFVNEFIDRCKPANAEKAGKRLRQLATKAATGKQNINAPAWAYEAAREAGMRGEQQQESAIHATLLYVGTHPDAATTLVMKARNFRETTAKPNGIGNTGGSTGSDS